MVTLVKTIATKLEDAYRHIKVQVMGKNDIQTPAEALPYGIDSNPVKDLVAVYAASSVKGEPVILLPMMAHLLLEARPVLWAILVRCWYVGASCNL